jgi:hypothetical protein
VLHCRPDQPSKRVGSQKSGSDPSTATSDYMIASSDTISGMITSAEFVLQRAIS